MSGVYRGFRAAHKGFLPVKSAASYQQERLAGNMHVKTNKFIEDWGTYRENLEYTFKWNTDSIVKIAVFAVAVPVVIYKLVIREFDKGDEAYNRPKRDFMGSSKDER